MITSSSGRVSSVSTASGVALTATAGWLITRASEQPPVLYLMVAIVAVRAAGSDNASSGRTLTRPMSPSAAVSARVHAGARTGPCLTARR